MRGPVPSATGPRPRREIDVDALLAGVLEDRRPVLARAITLLESTNPAHREKAQQLLLGALPHAGGALRIGITGVPGVIPSVGEAVQTRLSFLSKSSPSRVALLDAKTEFTVHS